MKIYLFEVPIVGRAIFECEAENLEEAKQRMFENIKIDDIEEWEAVEQIVKGNIFYGMLNQIEVEEEEIEDD